jgi:hypothetical protein
VGVGWMLVSLDKVKVNMDVVMKVVHDDEGGDDEGGDDEGGDDEGGDDEGGDDEGGGGVG